MTVHVTLTTDAVGVVNIILNNGGASNGYEEAGINGRAGVSAYWPLKAL